MRQEGVQGGLDRRAQTLRIELGDHRTGDRIGLVRGYGLQHRRQPDRHEDVARHRVGEPQARRLDPQQPVRLQRGVAAGRLDLLGIAADRRGKGRELRQCRGPHAPPRASSAAP